MSATSTFKPLKAVSVSDHSVDAPTCFEADGSPTWITRASHMVIAITKARAGAVLQATGVPDEHMVVLPDAAATLSVDGKVHHVSANTLSIVPPGNATLTAQSGGWVLRVFTSRHTAMLALASNADDFAEERGDVAPLQDGPPPPEGWRLRVYDLAAALSEGDKTRVFRSTNLMINVLRERHAPRDVAAMSPHSHADFEQASVTLSGAHLHHVRYPWTPDMRQWRQDEALPVGAPSVTVIPPQVIHTTRNIGSDPALLIDFFAPPRADFARRPGMVRNAADYPSEHDATLSATESSGATA